MGGFFYLVSRKAKNRVKEIFRRPAELIMLLLFAFSIGFTVFGSDNAHTYPSYTRDINELYAIILALYAFVFVMTAKNGFINGASMFSMADVNLIFTSPRKPKNVLTYGLLSQMGRSIFLGLFILYQYSWANDSYGIEYSFLIAVLIGYAAVVFMSQMVAMLIYSLTSNSEKLRNTVKTLFYIIVGAFLAYVGFVAYKRGDYLAGAVEAANSVFVKFFPVAGFVHYGVVGYATERYSALAVSLCCFVLFCALYYLLITVLNADYYEDVLKATETSFSAITARKEGKAVEKAPTNIRLGKTGIKKGQGASALFYKHKVENRRSRFFILDSISLVTALMTVAFAFFMKSPLLAFAFNIYVAVFTVSTGRWAKELILPYIYLIPEPPFKKLLFALKEQVPSLVVESLVTFIPVYFIGYSAVDEIAGFIIAKLSFSFLFIGVNLLFHRFFGGKSNKSFTLMLYMFVATATALPFVAVFLIGSSMLYLPLFYCFLMGSALNFLMAFVFILLCRDVLQCAEYNNK